MYTKEKEEESEREREREKKEKKKTQVKVNKESKEEAKYAKDKLTDAVTWVERQVLLFPSSG